MEASQPIQVDKIVEMEKEGTFVLGTFDKGKRRLHLKVLIKCFLV